jgi:hypothetical protein
MKSERALVNNNFNYHCSNRYSHYLYLTCYYIVYMYELHFLVKIHTAVLLTIFLLFDFFLMTAQRGPKHVRDV